MSFSMCEPLTANRTPIAVVCAAATRAVSNAGAGPRSFWARVKRNPLRAIVFIGRRDVPNTLPAFRLAFAMQARAYVMKGAGTLPATAQVAAASDVDARECDREHPEHHDADGFDARHMPSLRCLLASTHGGPGLDTRFRGYD